MLSGPNHDTAADERSDTPSGGGGGMGRVVIVLIVMAATVWGVRQYSGSSARVGAEDRRNGVKPVLMMFTADWCGPCQLFKAQVLVDGGVKARMASSCRFEKVDLTKWDGQPGAIAARYGVDAIPALLLVNSRGQEIDRYDGPFDPASFTRWLEQNAP